MNYHVGSVEEEQKIVQSISPEYAVGLNGALTPVKHIAANMRGDGNSSPASRILHQMFGNSNM